MSKTVKELNVTVEDITTGVFGLQIPLNVLEGANANSVVTLKVEGKADIALEFEATEQAFFNPEIQGYSKIEIENSIVTVTNN